MRQPLATLACCCAAALPAADDHWRARATPYLLLPTITGETALGRVGPQEIAVETDDVFSHLDVGFMLRGEVGHGRWSVLADLAYMDLEDEVRIGDLELVQLIAEGDLGYRIDLPRGWVELLAGARIWDLEATLAPLIGEDIGMEQSWIDPVVGARAALPLLLGFGLYGRGDLGGFGVGSDFTCQLEAGATWRPLPLLSVELGYRALAVDYEDGDRGERGYFAYDTVTHGVQLGLGVGF